MTKPDPNYILARLRARAKGEAIPPNPAQVLELAPAKPPATLPLAELLAQDAFVPKTEWEQALDRAMPSAQSNKRGANLHKAYPYKGVVGQPQALSKLPLGEATVEAMRATLTQRAEAKAKAEEDAPYQGTPQEKIAYHNAKIKAARGHKLTHADRKIIYKFNVAVILAKARAR